MASQIGPVQGPAMGPAMQPKGDAKKGGDAGRWDEKTFAFDSTDESAAGIFYGLSAQNMDGSVKLNCSGLDSDSNQITCSKKHVLKFASRSELLDAKAGYDNGFVCELCKRLEAKEGAHHCR